MITRITYLTPTKVLRQEEVSAPTREAARLKFERENPQLTVVQNVILKQ